MIVIVQGESVMRARALHLRFQVDALSDDVDTAKMRLASEMKVCSGILSEQYEYVSYLLIHLLVQ